MKLFCNCNSDWKIRTNDEPKISRRIIQSNYTRDVEDTWSIKRCPNCSLYPWYDADYENTMFDLRNMNS